MGARLGDSAVALDSNAHKSPVTKKGPRTEHNTHERCTTAQHHGHVCSLSHSLTHSLTHSLSLTHVWSDEDVDADGPTRRPGLCAWCKRVSSRLLFFSEHTACFCGPSLSFVSVLRRPVSCGIYDIVSGAVSPPDQFLTLHLRLLLATQDSVLCGSDGNCCALLRRAHRHLLNSAIKVSLMGHTAVQTSVAEGFLAMEATTHGSVSLV